MVVKSLGNGFFDAAHNGAKEAAKADRRRRDHLHRSDHAERRRPDRDHQFADQPEGRRDRDLGQRPERAGADHEKGDAARDQGHLLRQRPGQGRPPDAAEPVERAADRREADPDGGRTPSAAHGEIAILSASAQATNQNIWIGVMKKVLEKPEYAKLKLVATVYGDDQSDKSYREAIGLLAQPPEPEGDHRPDHGRHRRRQQGRGRRKAGRQSVRHRPGPAVRDGRPRQERRGARVRDLEPDRPRLRGHLRGQRIRQGQSRSQAGRQRLGRPHGHGRPWTPPAKPRSARRSPTTPTTSTSSPSFSESARPQPGSVRSLHRASFHTRSPCCAFPYFARTSYVSDPTVKPFPAPRRRRPGHPGAGTRRHLQALSRRASH